MFRLFRIRNCALPVLLALGLIFGGCGDDKPTPEDEAKAAFEKAVKLYDEGQIMEAMAEFERLAVFKDTQAFKDGGKFLIKKGISINDPRSSWTVIRMMDVQNELKMRDRVHDLKPGTMTRIQKRDAWGNFLWVVWAPDPKFIFVVKSAGPDQKPDTEDDLALYQQTADFDPKSLLDPEASYEDKDEKKKSAVDEYQEDDDMGRPSPSPRKKPTAKTDSKPEPKSPVEELAKPGRTGEPTVDLNDLLNKK